MRVSLSPPVETSLVSDSVCDLPSSPRCTRRWRRCGRAVRGCSTGRTGRMWGHCTASTRGTGGEGARSSGGPTSGRPCSRHSGSAGAGHVSPRHGAISSAGVLCHRASGYLVGPHRFLAYSDTATHLASVRRALGTMSHSPPAAPPSAWPGRAKLRNLYVQLFTQLLVKGSTSSADTTTAQAAAIPQVRTSSSHRHHVTRIRVVIRRLCYASVW